MTNKRRCSSLRPLRAISLSVVAAVAGLLLASPPAHAGTPDWLRSAASQQLPVYDKDTIGVILLDEQVTTVKDNGEIVTLYRRAYRILRTEGRELGTVVVYFDKETRLNRLIGWSITADGKDYESKEKEAVETSPYTSSFYEDTRYKILKIPASEPGNVVGYEYEQKRRPTILQDGWGFQNRIPVRRARLTLQLPQGWEFKTFWRHYPEKQARASGSNQWIWELENIPPVEHEPFMPAWQAVAGGMAVSYFPRGPVQTGGNQDSWKEVGRWYAQLTADRRAVTPQIKQKIVELTASASTLTDKVRALTVFVQKEVRYVAIEVGIGGYQPHLASDIFVNRYGDCKDKVTLLSAMLQEIGVKSDYILVQTRRGVVSPEFPTAREFNHVILAIRPAPGFDDKDLYAQVMHPRLGKLIIFDPTDSTTPLGYLPPTLQSNRGLLVTEEGGDLIELPLLPPATNRLTRSGKLQLDPYGNLSGEITEVRSGAPAVERRDRLLAVAASERTKVMEHILSGSLVGFRFLGATVDNLTGTDAQLTTRFRFTADHYAQTAGELVLVRPRVFGVKSQTGLQVKDRKYPVEMDYASVETDVYEIALPIGYIVDELPPPVELNAPFYSYRSKAEVIGNVLRYQRTYEMRTVEVPAGKVLDLEKFYRQVAADERGSAVIKRSAP